MQLASSILQRFVLPLVAGGELHVKQPLDSDDLDALWAEVVGETEHQRAIHRARQLQARELWLYPVPMSLDMDALALCVAIHNLLFLSHPAAGRWWTRSSSLDRVVAFTHRCLDGLRPLSTVEELIARHTLVGGLLQLERTDTTLRFWAGSRTFIGMEPPTRLRRWKSLRGVREDRQRVPWVASGLTAVQTDLLRKLLSRSPLTDLLSPSRSAPPFEWLPSARHLRRPLIGRLVCQCYLETGLRQVGPPLARAFWQLTDARGAESRATLRLAAGLVVYLYAATALSTDEDDHLQVDLSEATASLGTVLMAAARCQLIPDEAVIGDAKVARRLAAWAEKPAAQLDARADELAGSLRAALDPSGNVLDEADNTRGDA